MTPAAGQKVHLALWALQRQRAVPCCSRLWELTSSSRGSDRVNWDCFPREKWGAHTSHREEPASAPGKRKLCPSMCGWRGGGVSCRGWANNSQDVWPAAILCPQRKRQGWESWQFACPQDRCTLRRSHRRQHVLSGLLSGSRTRSHFGVSDWGAKGPTGPAVESQLQETTPVAAAVLGNSTDACWEGDQACLQRMWVQILSIPNRPLADYVMKPLWDLVSPIVKWGYRVHTCVRARASQHPADV